MLCVVREPHLCEELMMRIQRCFVLSLAIVPTLVGALPVHAQMPAPPKQPMIADQALTEPVAPIDLPTAVRLAGMRNPEMLLARERITEAVAIHQLAAAQLLPNINLGTNYDSHEGNLQQSNGNILNVNRGALYVGLGANAVGAGTVTIPGISYNLNFSEAIYTSLATKQVIVQRQFANEGVRNQTLLRVAAAYLALLRAEQRRAIAAKNRDELQEVARVTANYAKTGQGKPSDADRAAAELEQRNAELIDADADILTASAGLCQLLDLDPSVRLHVTDGWSVPAPIVPEPIPLPELLAMALAQRPELRERQAAIREAMLVLQGAKLLPFSPNLLFGYSAGSFGGGSNLVATRFGNFGGRQDVDVVLYWQLRNLGVGNLALIRQMESGLRSDQLRQMEILDRVRAEVARAHARTHARFAQISTNERAIQSSTKAYQEDLVRTRNREGLPIEVLDSLRLLARSRYLYLDAIIEYNLAQFELYVALGQPPAEFLARPAPAELLPPPVAPK
jgi:outer membrane protein TolC